MLIKQLKHLFQCFAKSESIHPPRKLLEPQTITKNIIDHDYTLISSLNYQFVIRKDHVQVDTLYQHNVDTPAAVLKKHAIHVFPDRIPELNRRQKYTALLKLLEQDYEKSYATCKEANEIFHLERRIKTEIIKKTSLIGTINGKYKHYLVFKSMAEENRERTIRQYEKNGLTVETLGEQIFPYGEVWLPTNQSYLKHFAKIITEISTNQNTDVLDIGTGSGVLSFLFGKTHKKAKIVGIDINPNALRTFQLNAAKLQLKNLKCFSFDVTKKDADFNITARENNLANKFDYVICNPPWIVASKIEGESVIADGVYDAKGKMLENSLKLAQSSLKNNNSRILLIYSDLSKKLKLQKKSVEDLCLKYNLIIEKRQEEPYAKGLLKKSPLNVFKNQSKIIFYQIKRS